MHAHGKNARHALLPDIPAELFQSGIKVTGSSGGGGGGCFIDATEDAFSWQGISLIASLIIMLIVAIAAAIDRAGDTVIYRS